MWERRLNGGYGFGEHNVIFYLMRRFFPPGTARPGGLFYKVGTDIALFFCFLRLLQDGFSVVLYFQHVLVSIGNNEIAVAPSENMNDPSFSINLPVSTRSGLSDICFSFFPGSISHGFSAQVVNAYHVIFRSKEQR